MSTQTIKTRLPFEKRLQLSTKLKNLYPDRYPIFIDKRSPTDFEITRNKFLVPSNYTVTKLLKEIRDHINNPRKNDPTKAINLFCQDVFLKGSDDISIIYNLYAEKDGFLYINYSVESHFG